MYSMFTASPAPVARILLFICCGQLMVTIGNAVETKDLNVKNTIQERVGIDIPGYRSIAESYWKTPQPCTVLRIIVKILPIPCGVACTDNDRCNAINYYVFNNTHSSRICYLLHCPPPIPNPTRIGPSYTAYAKIQGPTKPPVLATTDQFLGPLKKIWSDTECTHLENHWQVSLPDCKALCLKNATCTAMNFDENKYCVLRGCSPIPKPTLNFPTYQGFAKATDMYIGPFDKIWSDCQCLPISYYNHKSLAECETLCANDATCTAINFSEDDCILRACPAPVPPPKMILPPFQGYAIGAETKQCGNSRRCLRNNGKCISKINWESCDGRLMKRWCNGNQCACCVSQ